MDVITTQLNANKKIHMDLKMSNLKPNMCGKLHSAWLDVTTKPKLVIKGLKQTRLLSLDEKDFQRQAILENMENTLFNTNANALAIDFNNTL
jgi:hypothetical protein